MQVQVLLSAPKSTSFDRSLSIFLFKEKDGVTKMKKFGLAILILTVLCIVILAFLEPKINEWLDDSPKHSTGESSTTASSTTESSTTEGTSSKPVPVCAHDWVFESSTVTCSKDGEKLYRCSKCQETKTENDPAYGCYDEDKNGLCDGCGIVTGECEHKFVTEKGYDATCTQDGQSDKRYCSKCEMVLEEHAVIPALGHQRAVLEAVASTCISEGLTEGEHCSRCKLVFIPQNPIPLSDHVGSEGVCTVCDKITDAKLALGFYIVRNGTKRDDGGSYFISKSVEKFIYLNRYTGIAHIEFNPETLELMFWGESTTMGVVGDMKMILDMNSNIQRIDLKGTYQDSNGYAIGTIDTKKFSSSYMILESFEYDAGNRTEDEQWYRAYFSVAISEMLILSAEIMAETNTGVTMPMLGFSNY
jgi:hypothetical protein